MDAEGGEGLGRERAVPVDEGGPERTNILGPGEEGEPGEAGVALTGGVEEESVPAVGTDEESVEDGGGDKASAGDVGGVVGGKRGEESG